MVCTRPPRSATRKSHLSTDWGASDRKVSVASAVPLVSFTISKMPDMSPKPSSRTTPSFSGSMLKMDLPVEDNRFIFSSESIRMPLEQLVNGEDLPVDRRVDRGVWPRSLPNLRLSKETSRSRSSSPCRVFFMTLIPSRPTTKDRSFSPKTRLVSSDVAFRSTRRPSERTPACASPALTGSSMSISSTHCCCCASVSPPPRPPPRPPAYTPSSLWTFSSLRSVWYLFSNRCPL